MIKFSANLGFLWTDLPLTERIEAAAAAGFANVEFHFPYEISAADLAAAIKSSGLAPVSLNTSRGGDADFGLAALPGREAEARAAIDQALATAKSAQIPMVHVMAGLSKDDPAAADTFESNLRYALDNRGDTTIVIEPINRRDAPQYFLGTLPEAAALQDKIGDPALKVMFDCYHMQIMGGDLLARFRENIDRIGHVQFAGVPDRGEPDQNEVDYGWLLPAIQDAGYHGPFGAEYRPRASTDQGLGWMKAFG